MAGKLERGRNANRRTAARLEKEQKESQAFALRSKGYTFDQIGRAIGVGPDQARNIFNAAAARIKAQREEQIEAEFDIATVQFDDMVRFCYDRLSGEQIEIERHGEKSLVPKWSDRDRKEAMEMLLRVRREINTMYGIMRQPVPVAEKIPPPVAIYATYQIISKEGIPPMDPGKLERVSRLGLVTPEAVPPAVHALTQPTGDGL